MQRLGKMEQYKTNSEVQIPKIVVKSEEEKSIDTLSSKVRNLENYTEQLEAELRKQHREILRLKDDINSITVTLRGR